MDSSFPPAPERDRSCRRLPSDNRTVARSGANAGRHARWSAAVLFLFLAASTLSGAAAASEASFDQGVRLYNQKSYRAAIQYFDQAARVNPKLSTAFYYEALCYQQLGDFEKAKQVYRSVCETFPGTQEAELSAGLLKRVDPSYKGPSQGLVILKPSAAESAVESLKVAKISDEEWSRLPDVANVPFTRKSGGHIYMDASVNGRAIKVIFDTGAETCLFGRNQLQAIGVKLDLSGPVLGISGIGARQTAQTMTAEVKVGDISRRIPIWVQDNLPTDPLLGQTFFNEFKYEIDNRGAFVHFQKKPRPGSRSRIYEPMDMVCVPFTPRGNNMVVNVEVNGHPCPMYFDTGASSIVFTAFSLAALGIGIPEDAQPVMGGGVGGSTAGYRFNIDRLQLGPILKTHVPVVVLQAGPALPLLGQSFFGDRRFTIDNENHLIKFVH